jgi:hypothetical protein
MSGNGTDHSSVIGTYTVAPGDTIDVQVSNNSSTVTRSVSWSLGG